MVWSDEKLKAHHRLRLVWRIVVPPLSRNVLGAGRAARTTIVVAAAIAVGLIIPPLFIEGVYFSLGGSIANAILVHEAPPSDNEGPPVAGARPYSSDDVMALGGRGEGLNCSLPPGIERAFFDRSRNFSPEAQNRSRRYAPISLQMRQACAQHDYCYRHGAATYGYSQGDCDYILQEHAYRLCRAFSTPQDADKCRTKARMITLGVRIGGATSFKGVSRDAIDTADAGTESRYSTYFEFDPYPLRSSAYSVARIADAPSDWVDARAKALYVFTFHRSGMRVQILGWKKGSAPTEGGSRPAPQLQRTFTVNGRFDVLSTPPLVTRSVDAAGDSVDYFAFWQRFSMQNTGGRMLIIAPGSATPEHWRILSDPTPDARTTACDAAAPEARHPAAILSFRQGADCSSKPRDDFDVSEFHAMPTYEGPQGIRLIGLRRTPCVNEFRASCHLEMDLAPGKLAASRYVPPFRAIAPHGGLADGDPAYHSDRYRAFVAPPFAASVEGHSKALVMWSRRGDATGVDYRDHVDLRRHMANTDTSRPARYFPEVRLKNLQEEHEPVALLNRHGAGQTFVSLSAERRTFMQNVINTSSPLFGRLLDYLDNEAAIDSAPRILRGWTLPKAAEATARQQLVVEEQKCNVRIAPEWLMRAPVVDAQARPPRIVMSRIDMSASTPRINFAELTIATDPLACAFRTGASNATGELTPAALRRWPLLVARLDGSAGPATLLLVNLDAPERSLLYLSDSAAAP